MIKEKLIKTRKQRGYTQQQLADKLSMNKSNYNRREKGEINVSNVEWEKISEVLDVPIEDVYQANEGQVLIFKDNSDCNNNSFGNNNQTYSIPEFILENQKKYIEKLEKEIEELKNNRRD
jgi:transcriptional regulator with XRE-family HTH domain